MRIEHAELGDLKEIKEIFSSAKKQMFGLDIKQWTADYPSEADMIKDIHSSELLIFRNSEKQIVSIGTLTQTPYKSDDQHQFTKNDWFIKRLAVRAQESGHGLGMSWIQCSLEEFCETGSRIYSLTNHTNWAMQRLFMKTGFKKTGEILIKERSAFGPFYVYRKDR